MRRISYRGILDIGWRYDARDGSYKLLDPNPRIGATFRLFVGTDGMDVARFLYLDMTGQPLPESAQKEGRKWWIEDRDFESTLDYIREGSLTWRAWARSFREVEEAAWFAKDDLKPFLVVLAETAGRAMRKLIRVNKPKREVAVAPKLEAGDTVPAKAASASRAHPHIKLRA